MNEPTDQIESILRQRSTTHGSFGENARITDGIRNLIRSGGNWGNLCPVQRLALDEIALKMARIVSSGSNVTEFEHWNDISGYGRLPERTMSGVTQAKPPASS